MNWVLWVVAAVTFIFGAGTIVFSFTQMIIIEALREEVAKLKSELTTADAQAKEYKLTIIRLRRELSARALEYGRSASRAR